MYGHGTQTATEWQVVFRTTLGTLHTEWCATRESADSLIERYTARGLELVSCTIAVRVLDY